MDTSSDEATERGNTAAPTSLDRLAAIKARLSVITFISVVAALYFAKDVILPITLGVLIALTLSPIVRALTVGRALEMNIVAVFLTVVFWAWLWGVAGALMAVPILVLIKVICDHVDSLTTLGRLIGSREFAKNDLP